MASRCELQRQETLYIPDCGAHSTEPNTKSTSVILFILDLSTPRRIAFRERVTMRSTELLNAADIVTPAKLSEKLASASSLRYTSGIIHRHLMSAKLKSIASVQALTPSLI